MEEINADFWSKADSACLYELAALVAGINPKRLTVRSVLAGGWNAVRVDVPTVTVEDKQAFESYQNIVLLAEGSLKAGLLDYIGVSNRQYGEATTILVAEFARWAGEKGIVIPPMLQRAHLAKGERKRLDGWKPMKALWAEITGRSVSDKTAIAAMEKLTYRGAKVVAKKGQRIRYAYEDVFRAACEASVKAGAAEGFGVADSRRRGADYQ